MTALDHFSAAWADAMIRTCYQGTLLILVAALSIRGFRITSPGVRSAILLVAAARLIVGLMWFAPIPLPVLTVSDARVIGHSAQLANGRPGEAQPAVTHYSQAGLSAPTEAVTSRPDSTLTSSARPKAATVLFLIWALAVSTGLAAWVLLCPVSPSPMPLPNRDASWAEPGRRAKSSSPAASA